MQVTITALRQAQGPVIRQAQGPVIRQAQGPVIRSASADSGTGWSMRKRIIQFGGP